MKSTRKYRSSGKSTKWKRLLFIVLSLFIGGLTWWGVSEGFQAGREWLAGTKWSNLENVEVRGLKRLPEHDIICAADVSPGMNLMEIEPDSIARQVAALPPVQRAQVFRRFPGRLVIRVVEREPIAGVGNGMLQLIDRDAVMFSPVYGGEVLDVPIITGDFKQNSNDRNLKTAFDFLRMIYDSYPVVYKEIGEVNYQDNKISLRLKRSGASVIVDDPCREEILNGLSTFLTQKIDELPVSIDYLDLRYPAMVIAGKESRF